MTETELSELLAHPRVRAYIAREAKTAAVRAVAEMSRERPLTPRSKPAAEGDLNYTSAASYIGCPRNSVRGYAHAGVLEKGKLPATVTLASCERFRKTYRPCLKGRITK